MVFNLARIVGPAVAGVMITWIGTGWLFLVNAASFGAMTLSTLAKDLEDLARSGSLDGAAPRVERLAGECERVTRALREIEREPRP